MSKLVERLEKVDQVDPEPMGFSAVSTRRQAKSPVILLGRLGSDDLMNNQDIEVDAILVSAKSWKKRSINKISKCLKDRLWGACVSNLDRDSASHLKDKGCDFIVIEDTETEASILNDDTLGRFVTVGSDFSEDMARAVHDLPFDGAVFAPAENLLPLSIGKILSVHQIRSMISKPFLMDIPADIEAPELETIRNIGIFGLILDNPSEDEVSLIRSTAAKLPNRKPSSRATALIPQISHLQTANLEEEEEEEVDAF